MQGLEDFRLVEKMGDGAFSNVYKAIQRSTGQKCAVKVVRKYELNSSQVSFCASLLSSPPRFILFTLPPFLTHLPCAGHTRDQGGEGLYSFCFVCFKPSLEAHL